MRTVNVRDAVADVTLAARRLRRTPAFTIAAILLLGVGMAIAAATASLVNIALFKDPARGRGLVHLAAHLYVSHLPDEAVRKVLASPPSTFDSLAGFSLIRRTAVAEGVSHPVSTEAVTGRYFTLLGGVPLMGRLIDEADDRQAAPVAVISKSLWRSVFGERPDILGASIAVAGQRLEVVGVIERPIRPGGRGADLWVPSSILPVDTLFGRLRSGITAEQATAEVSARYGTFQVDGTNRPLVVLDGMSNPQGLQLYADLVWVLAIAIIVSLVASASFGLLLFARMAATESAMAVRIALGATTRDLTRLLASEVVLLALAAAVVAVNVGGWLSQFGASQVIEMSGWRSAIDTSSDWRVWLVVCGLTLAVALLVVVRLSWSIVRVEALGSMVATGGMGGATIRTAGTSARLVIAQSAATAALLLVAALIARNALPASRSLAAIDDSIIITRIAPDTTQAAASRMRGLLEVAAAMADVRHAALMSGLPGNRSLQGVTLNRDGRSLVTDVHHVGADVFPIFRMGVLRGRTFTAQEDADGLAVAVVTETAARRFWPSVDPIGQRLSIQRTPEARLEVVVIGVVADAVDSTDERAPGLGEIFLPFTQRPPTSGLALAAVVEGDAERRLESFRSTLQRAFPDTGLVSVRTMRQEILQKSQPPPGLVGIIGLLGSIVFVVAMGGLYGLMSYLATMRRREIGIRKALGATGMTLSRMLVRESSPTLGAGIGIGLLVGLTLTSLFVRDMTFRMLDPVAIGGVGAFLYTAGLLGAIAPYTGALRERHVHLKD